MPNDELVARREAIARAIYEAEQQRTTPWESFCAFMAPHEPAHFKIADAVLTALQSRPAPTGERALLAARKHIADHAPCDGLLAQLDEALANETQPVAQPLEMAGYMEYHPTCDCARRTDPDQIDHEACCACVAGGGQIEREEPDRNRNPYRSASTMLAKPTTPERVNAQIADALAEALCLLDTFAGEGLGHVYGNGQQIDADTVCTELGEALGIECEPGWWRRAADMLSASPPEEVAP